MPGGVALSPRQELVEDPLVAVRAEELERADLIEAGQR